MATKSMVADFKNNYQLLASKVDSLLPFQIQSTQDLIFQNERRFINFLRHQPQPNLNVSNLNQNDFDNQEFIDPSNQPPTNVNYPENNFVDDLAKGMDNPTKLFRGKPKTKEHKNWKLKKVLIGHTSWVRCMSFDPSNEFFATGSTDRTIKFWDLASGNLMLTLTGHVASVRGVEISKNHPYLFSCSEDKLIKCWDLNNNKCIRSFYGHLSGVYTIALHPDMNIFSSGGRDSIVRVWDIRTRQMVHTLEGHSDIVNTVVMQNDEPQLISASSDSTIRLWDLVAGKNFNVLTNHKKGIRALKLHPIEYTFVSAAQDNIKLWKCPDGGFLRNFSKNNSGELINCIDINGNDLLASGSDLGRIRIYDWESGDMVQEIKTINQPGSLEAENSIYDVKFDLSATRLISCECDKSVKVWEQESD